MPDEKSDIHSAGRAVPEGFSRVLDICATKMARSYIPADKMRKTLRSAEGKWTYSTSICCTRDEQRDCKWAKFRETSGRMDGWSCRQRFAVWFATEPRMYLMLSCIRVRCEFVEISKETYWNTCKGNLRNVCDIIIRSRMGCERSCDYSSTWELPSFYQLECVL